MPVAYQFANASTTIPLSQLDANFASPITLGNTSIQLGNSVSTLNNLTLANVTISSGNIAFAIPATSGGTGLVSPGTTGNVLTSNGTAWVSTSAAAGTGVTALSFGSTGLTPSTATSGNVTVSGTLSVGSGGTGLQSLTSNSVLLGNGSSTIQFVSPGTTGNVLTSNGTTWSSSAPAGGGSALTLISTQTVSNVSSVSWTGLSTYDRYTLLYENAFPATTSYKIALRFGTGSGPTYITSGYIFSGISVDSNITTAGSTNAVCYAAGVGNSGTISSSSILMFAGGSGGVSGSSPGARGIMNICNMTSGFVTTITSQSFNNSSPGTSEVMSGATNNSTSKTAIQILSALIDGVGGVTLGNISGTFSLYGITT